MCIKKLDPPLNNKKKENPMASQLPPISCEVLIEINWSVNAKQILQ
jgi:hypothetical protein